MEHPDIIRLSEPKKNNLRLISILKRKHNLFYFACLITRRKSVVELNFFMCVVCRCSLSGIVEFVCFKRNCEKVVLKIINTNYN